MLFHRCQNAKVALETLCVVVMNITANHFHQFSTVREAPSIITLSLQNIQLKDTTADAAIAQIHTLLSDTLNKQVVFSNRIEGNRMIQSTYWAFHLVVYAFLIVIAGITILNIINSISMSVSARMKQYGILRAIGMDDAQLKRMISAEAGTYAVSGLVVGIALGLVLNRKLYILLITHYFGAAWQVPWGCLAVIVVVVLAAVVLAVYNPVRRILMQPITATISEL